MAWLLPCEVARQGSFADITLGATSMVGVAAQRINHICLRTASEVQGGVEEGEPDDGQQRAG